jgi:hypothetical protein
MILKRLKLFGKREKIIMDEIKRCVRDFGNADGSYKSLKSLSNLDNKELLTLSKILPNHLTNSELLNKKGKLEIPEETWNVIKKLGYFKEGEANNITREQLESYVNMVKDKVNNRNKYIQKNKPELYKYITGQHGSNMLDLSTVRYSKHLDKNKVFTDEEYNLIKNRRLHEPIVDPNKEIKNLKNDNTVKRLDIGIHESKLLDPGAEFSHLGKTEENQYNQNLLNYLKNQSNNILDEQDAAMIEYFLKDKGDINKNIIFLPKNKGYDGLPSHEVGHIIEESNSQHLHRSTDKPEIRKLKNELRYTDNSAGPIQQLGNEGMASLRGLSRYKGENKEQATKNLFDAFSTYIADNSNNIIRGKF